jgi:hypothetical protein
MTKTVKSNLSDVWATGHPGANASPNQSGVVTAHRVIFGSIRDGMGIGTVLPQVLDLARKTKR